MKKGNNLYKKLVIFSLVAFIFLTAFNTGALSSKENIKKYNINKIDNKESRRIDKGLIELKNFNKNIDITKNIQNVYGNVPILSTGNNCQNPAITSNGENILVVAEESVNILNSDIIITYSSDNGNSWSELFGWNSEDSFEEKPVIDFCYNNEFQAYGTCMPDLISKTLNLYHFPSMTDPEISFKESDGWTVWSTTLSNFYEFYAIDIAGYPHGNNAPAQDFHGIITLIGYSDYGETIENYYETENMGIGACYLDFDGELGDTISVDIDLSTETYFEAFELRADEDIGIEDGVFFEYCWVEPGNEDWWENDWPAYIFEGASNPDLVAENGQCYVICEVANEIICYYSHDNGESFESSVVSSNGILPSVSLIGDTLICSYINNNNIFTTTSEDGGVSWDDNIQINEIDGSVISQDSGIDLFGDNLVWTDDRSGSNVIYYGKAGEVSIPIIKIESVTGGLGLTAEIKNTGTADATNIDWSISFDGGVLFGGDNRGTIDTLTAGDSITIKSKFVIGLGNTDITINLEGDKITKSAKIILFFLLGL